MKITHTLSTLGSKFSSARGYSIAEATIVMSAISILTATMAPAASEYLAEARLTKATSDVQTIAVVLSRATDDLGPFAHDRDGWATYDLLVGEGEAPAAGEGGDPAWTLPLGDARVGSLDAQLVTNAPGYKPLPYALGAPKGWRGPYIASPVTPDPWGGRYAVNIKWLETRGHGFNTVVVSSGPNGAIEIPFGRRGLAEGGDDVIGLIAGGR